MDQVGIEPTASSVQERESTSDVQALKYGDMSQIRTDNCITQYRVQTGWATRLLSHAMAMWAGLEPTHALHILG